MGPYRDLPQGFAGNMEQSYEWESPKTRDTFLGGSHKEKKNRMGSNGVP